MDDKLFFVMRWGSRAQGATYTTEPMDWYEKNAYRNWPEDCIGKDLTLEEAEAMVTLLNASEVGNSPEPKITLNADTLQKTVSRIALTQQKFSSAE